MTDGPFPVYVGWDSRADISYQVCRHSLLKRASIPVTVTAIRRQELRDGGPALPAASMMRLPCSSMAGRAHPPQSSHKSARSKCSGGVARP